MSPDAPMEDVLRNSIRNIPDYPEKGVMFRDITTLLGDARAFRLATDALVQRWSGAKIDKVAGIEARGFILGGAIASIPACPGEAALAQMVRAYADKLVPAGARGRSTVPGE